MQYAGTCYSRIMPKIYIGSEKILTRELTKAYKIQRYRLWFRRPLCCKLREAGRLRSRSVTACLPCCLLLAAGRDKIPNWTSLNINYTSLIGLWGFFSPQGLNST